MPKGCTANTTTHWPFTGGSKIQENRVPGNAPGIAPGITPGNAPGFVYISGGVTGGDTGGNTGGLEILTRN